MKIRWSFLEIVSITMNEVFINDRAYEEKMNSNGSTKSLLLLVASLGLTLMFSLAVNAHSQDPAPQPPEQAAQDDPIRQLNLTPEQRQKIRAITEDNRDERMRINRRVREAQFALEQTLDADSPSEATVEDRIREVANAQAAQIRMRALTELRIRSVLTPDQLRTWREIRTRSQSLRRQLNNPDSGRRDAQRNLPNQRNGISPLFPGDRRGVMPVRPRP